MFIVTLLISIIFFALLFKLILLVFSKVLGRKSASTILFVGSALIVTFGVVFLVLRHVIGVAFLVIAVLWIWRGVRLRGTQ